MAEPKSLSAKEITAAARGTVDRVLEQHGKILPRPPYILGFLPPPRWIGIILRDPPDTLTLGQAEKIATDLTRSIAEKVPAVKAGKPGVVVQGGHTTIGFVPPLDIEFMSE